MNHLHNISYVNHLFGNKIIPILIILVGVQLFILHKHGLQLVICGITSIAAYY